MTRENGYAQLGQEVQNRLEAKPDRTDEENALLAVLHGPDGVRKKMRLRQMERKLRFHYGYSTTAAIDWSKIDWGKLFESILKLLITLLPLFMGTNPETGTAEPV